MNLCWQWWSWPVLLFMIRSAYRFCPLMGLVIISRRSNPVSLLYLRSSTKILNRCVVNVIPELHPLVTILHAFKIWPLWRTLSSLPSKQVKIIVLPVAEVSPPDLHFVWKSNGCLLKSFKLLNWNTLVWPVICMAVGPQLMMMMEQSKRTYLHCHAAENARDTSARLCPTPHNQTRSQQ